MSYIRLLLFFTGLTPSLWALQTAYVSFDHPEGWRCELSQGVWICQSTQEPQRRESVVLSIATMATEWDTVDNYLDYLKKSRTVAGDDGAPIESKVTYARKRVINGVTWVDSLQEDSELPGFWSRYVATVHNKLAILITYVVSKEQYKTLAPQFERMVASLKPNAEFDLAVASKQGETPLPGNEKLGPLQANILKERLRPVAPVPQQPVPAEAPDAGSSSLPLLGAVAVIAGGAIWWLRKRRKSKAGPRRRDAA